MRINTLINKRIELEKEHGNIEVNIDDFHYFVGQSVHNKIKSVKFRKNKLHKNGKYILIKGY